MLSARNATIALFPRLDVTESQHAAGIVEQLCQLFYSGLDIAMPEKQSLSSNLNLRARAL
jgi:hypothetical protein